MKFILYDIFLNVAQVDEAYEAHAEIQDRFILLSTPGNHFRNMDGDKFLFDLFRDDTFKNHSTQKVNTRIRVFSNNEPSTYRDYYANISYLDYLKIIRKFNKLWFQKGANIMWFMNLAIAILATIASTYVSIKLSDSKVPTKIEIITPTHIDDSQFEQIIKTLQTTKTLNLDSTQIRILIERLKSTKPKKK